MPTYRLTIAYDGTHFSGWQAQPGGQRTVQGEIAQACRTLFGSNEMPRGTGRTDAGTHATGQVVAVDIPKKLPCDKIRIALDGTLPKDIIVKSVKLSKNGDNPRFSSLGKTYIYNIWNRPERSLLYSPYSWHIRKRLDIEAMRQSAGLIQACRNFGFAQASGGAQRDMTVKVSSICLRRSLGMIVISFTADRFLYKMVRNLTGLLVLVGLGKLSLEDISNILSSQKALPNKPTAPAHGLFLSKVLF